MEYGVNISNKFAFLDDDGADPDELIARVQKEKKEKAKLAKVQAKKPAVVEAPTQPVKADKENLPKKAATAETTKRFPKADKEKFSGHENENNENRRPGQQNQNRGPRGPPRPRRNNASSEENNDGAVDNNTGANGTRPPRRFQNREFTGNRDFGGKGPRGPGGPRSDRVSGSDKTGVRSVPKRGGHGRGNWGDDKDELVGETEQQAPTNLDDTQPKVETVVTEGEEPAVENTNTQEKEEEVPEEEKEAPKLTLEEWKAQKATEKPKFNTRKANEGADQKSLQKFIPLKREDEAAKEEVVTEEEVSYTKRALREKPLDIEVNFGDSHRNRNSRDGPPRGPFRGGNRDGDHHHNNSSYGGRQNGPRPGNSGGYGGGAGPSRRGPGGPGRAPQLNLSKPEEFPELGAH